MPSTIGKCKLYFIVIIIFYYLFALLEGETFLRNKHEIAFFEIKCTFFGKKENTITYVIDYYNTLDRITTQFLTVLML